MGCISTPMPNHLSTRLSLFHHIRAVGSEEMSGVGKVEVWKKRRTDRLVEMKIDEG